MQASLIEQELEPADAPAPGPSCAEPAGEFGPRWTPVDFVGGSPGSRVFPSAVVSGACVYIFGGHNGTTYRNDLLVLSLETRSWTVDSEVDGDGRPTPRDAHAAVLLGGRLYVFGGYDSKRYLADFHSYGPLATAITWSERKPCTPMPQSLATLRKSAARASADSARSQTTRP